MRRLEAVKTVSRELMRPRITSKLMLQFLSKIVSRQREKVLLAAFKVSELVLIRYLSVAFFYS